MERDLPSPAYTVASLAQRWGVSDTFVYKEIERGRLRYFKLGNKLIRIRPEWVDEYENSATARSYPEMITSCDG